MPAGEPPFALTGLLHFLLPGVSLDPTTSSWNSIHPDCIRVLMSETLDAILCLFVVGVLIAAAFPISSYRTWHGSHEGASHPATFPNLPV